METAEHPVPVHDQLGFFLFIAFSLHLMFILGVGFAALPENTATPQLEVTLAQYRSEKTPEEAHFIAQSNQEGSGTLAERAELTTRKQAEFSDNRIREAGAAAQKRTPRSQSQQRVLVTTINDTVDQVMRKREQPEPLPEPLPVQGLNPEIRKLNETIASLEARLDRQQQAYAERPRVRRLTSLSARAAVDAAYLHGWRTRVEAIGNRYYPVASSRYGIYGDLRLMVAIHHDGSIANIEILSSSGHAVLDEAAIRIVRMAAPFDPFPPELRATTDMLEIIRTWKFRQNRLSSIQG
jgi:protein TonB